VIATILPRLPLGHTAPLIYPGTKNASLTAVLQANLSSFILDYCARQKIGGTHLTYGYFEQFPILPPATYALPCAWANDPKSESPNPPSLRDWLLPRVLELTYTAWDLEAFAADCGWNGPPFRWDEERRFLLRCELDAAFFHLYLGPAPEWQQQPEALTRAFPTPRHAVSYIMDTFPIVKRKDESKHGNYRTKETILEIYDALTESIRTSTPYQTRLAPPPADPACCHPPRVTAPAWMDLPLVSPVSPRAAISADLYRASVVPQLLYQAGGRLSFDHFRRAYWLLAEPQTLQRYARGEICQEAIKWGKAFKDRLAKDMFILHLRSAIRYDIQFITLYGERWLQLRRTDHITDDEHVIFDARLALVVADLWPVEEPISPLTPEQESAIKELELLM
jgi:hypothetical protein